jgi:NAD(P)-dependent dehydrogenase (short-subunit alcohol dehydrogenase family)
MDRLKGKVAIITGSGTGLGRAIAQLFVEEEAKVVVADIREKDGEGTVKIIRDMGGEAIFVKTDVSKSADVQNLVHAAEDRYGKLNIMVANAGIMGRGSGKPLAEIPEEEWWEIVNVNLGGVFLCFKYAIPAILRAGGGAMTATASLAAHRAFKRNDAYCASKGAIVSMVRSLAYDLAPTIRVNAVSPGAMKTELIPHMNEAKGITTPTPPMGALQPGQPPPPPIRRFSDPREVACAHLYLVSDEASFITGQTLIADGGWGIPPASA